MSNISIETDLKEILQELKDGKKKIIDCFLYSINLSEFNSL